MAWIGILGANGRFKNDLNKGQYRDGIRSRPVPPQYSCRNIAATPDCDHEIGLELAKNPVSRGLTELVDLGSYQPKKPLTGVAQERNMGTSLYVT